MSHTPGPWYVTRDFEIFSDDDEVLDSYIADIISKNGNYTDDDAQERLANATLIAAAPDLLAACENALAFVEPFQKSSGMVGRLAQQLKRAIAKVQTMQP